MITTTSTTTNQDSNSSSCSTHMESDIHLADSKPADYKMTNSAPTKEEGEEDEGEEEASKNNTISSSGQQTGSNTNISSASSSSSSSGIQSSSSGIICTMSTVMADHHQHHKSSISSTSSSMMTNSTASPTHTSTCILTTSSPMDVVCPSKLATNSPQHQHQQQQRPARSSSQVDLASAASEHEGAIILPPSSACEMYHEESGASSAPLAVAAAAPQEPHELEELANVAQQQLLSLVEASQTADLTETTTTTTVDLLLESNTGIETERQMQEADPAVGSAKRCHDVEDDATTVLMCDSFEPTNGGAARREEIGDREEFAARLVEEVEGAPLDGGHRLERSNSCSQAECAKNSVSSSALIGDQDDDVPNAAIIKASPISLSHDNLATTPAPETTITTRVEEDKTRTQQNLPPTKQLEDKQAANNKQQQQQQQQQQSTSSRFFSSKLNTGSLWSLLSTGSTNSTTNISEHLNDDSIRSSNDSYRDDLNHHRDEQQQTISNKAQSLTASTSNFLSRYQFKMPLTTTTNATTTTTSTSLDRQYTTGGHQQSADNQLDRRRFRFNVKYIGSALLHKNFTLPMLEWIAKDIRRQTIRGAQSTNQRQFTIPTREIIFEIQFNQLRAISCKDGHCKFVHPMHCVSKYVQLQHDPTNFAYIIRDTKESQNFCHVFQAKSANKVHDIFSAIREIAKSSGQPANSQHQQPVGVNNRLQKSASTDGHWKSLLSSSSSGEFIGGGTFMKQPPAPPLPLASLVQAHQQQHQRGSSNPTTPMIGDSKGPSTFTGVSDNFNNRRETSTTAATSTSTQSMVASNKSCQEAAIQFENSYQFEVMFVKRVKLQCRRVPASFVDDALETLKSFEVLKADSKSSHIKSGVVGAKSRIINASVDERQEYDESCQSPTSSSAAAFKQPLKGHLESIDDDQRRGSSASLNKQERANCAGSQDDGSRRKSNEERESKSCQQSPSKAEVSQNKDNLESQQRAQFEQQHESGGKKHHQSVDCLKSLDETIRTSKSGQPPTYTNDFSPYNTITSTDLNERIAAIPVVSSSVSLDHETRQRLARQVRETIQATAANIKKGVYASGDKLDSTTKALDSLSCTATTTSAVVSLPGQRRQESHQESSPPESLELIGGDSLHEEPSKSQQREPPSGSLVSVDPRQQNSSWARQQQQASSVVSNNFDLFRRASARQVVKNRTMLLLIGKDELCAISIDKHQMLFSKSFNSIVHCLQGNSNRDHFGLICRDSGKVNPMTESYVGYVFKCQSDKVVREIMGALKQVIYSSQHNYHGHNSPYNPLNSIVAVPSKSNKDSFEQLTTATMTTASSLSGSQSLATKRGFSNRHADLDLSAAATTGKPQQESSQMASGVTSGQSAAIVAPAPPPPPPPPPTAPILGHSTTNSLLMTHTNNQHQVAAAAAIQKNKNPIKSMFCDNCPLYWYHRLCCDVESMPAEASKTIILRRIDSSLSDKEQDEVYSRFSEFNIESIEEHNEIFMSILRHQNERKQLKHSTSQSHQAAIAKNNLMLARQSSSSAATTNTTGGPLMEHQPNSGLAATTSGGHQSRAIGRPSGGSHQRSGSTSGSLAFVLNQTNSAGQTNAQAAGQSIADASSVAIDNLKRAKNSISVSIENMLKRRSSMKDELADEQQSTLSIATSMPVRSGSFKGSSREKRSNESNPTSTTSNQNQNPNSNNTGNLKRSQSTSDYSQGVVQQLRMPASWRDSLARTINETELSNPLANLFGLRRGSQARDEQQTDDDNNNSKVSSSRASNENLTASGQQSHHHSPSRQKTTGSLTPSSMLPGVFWKKSIFDKIKQPISGERGSPISPPPPTQTTDDVNDVTRRPSPEAPQGSPESQRRTKEELRSLWRKAILEQITLLKMDKQNQKLQVTSNVECNIQRIKLNYRDVLFGRDAIALWDRLLRQDPTKKVEFTEVSRLVRLGLPKQRRGEVWMFLMNQYQLRHGTSFQPADSEYGGDANQAYRSLLSRLSTQQHEIFVDIGRTFPSHPYYSQYLSIGQLSLFNLLKAYSLLDQEVGYCQGLSFVAGILLLHVDSEDEAFELMRHLLFNFGLRKQYLPSMNALHLQLYQITRLLRDYEYDIFNHFDQQDISPSLYAAPWFLTLFASQFPLGFVSRLLDLIFLIGIEAIFRVSLTLLAYHKSSLLNCTSLEATMEFIRADLTKIDDKSLVKLFDKSMTLDLRNKLIEYEIEYSFYCAEDKARTGNSQINHHHHHHHHHQHQQNSLSKSSSSSANNTTTAGDESQQDSANDRGNNKGGNNSTDESTTSEVADATATVIIQHLLANNHLRSLRTNYSY